VRARLYDSACFLLSSHEDGLKGGYRELNPKLSFRQFMTSLLARAIAVAKMQPPGPPAAPKIEAGPPDSTGEKG
jgi:hypothetical protein